MSKDGILYVKGMNMSDSESLGNEESEEDIWDDTKLNQAYDKAVSLANAEIAKRVAMATNNRISTEAKASTSKVPAESAKDNKNKQKASNVKQKSSSEWKVGMPCRAVYDADGLDYEAFLLRIINDEECVVRFLGYENSEVVSISSLKPSRGNKERAQQIEEALCINAGNTEEDETLVRERRMDCDQSAGGGERLQRRRKKSAKKSKKPSFEMPTELPFSMSDLPSFNNMNFPSLDIPMAMPPPLPLTPQQASGNAEEQAMCSMLLSWYCSGYYTGLYQGMKRAKQQQQQRGSRSSH